MENIDIERLERKNIYSVPKDFFGKMQQNVLEKTAAKTEASIIPGAKKKNGWWYAAAAAIVAVLGLGYLFTNEQPAQQTLAKTIETEQVAEPIIQNAEPESILEENFSDESQPVLTFAENINPSQTERPENPAASPRKIQPKKAPSGARQEVLVEQVIAGMTQDEVADYIKGAENDVYLDIYY